MLHLKLQHLVVLSALFAAYPVAGAQTANTQNTAPAPQQTPVKHRGRSAAGEYGSGAGSVGKGAAGGVGKAAKGAGEVVTLHPIKGAESVGKGGKDVAVGAAKGTGKVIKGTGKIFTHPF